MYDAIIFDLDGTLCDTMPDIHASVCMMLDLLGYPGRELSHTVNGINRGSRHLIEHALPDGVSKADVDAALDCYMKFYSEHLCDATAPYAGITDLLPRLRDRGVKLAVLSNKPDTFVSRLAAALFPDTFTVTVGQGPYPAKPSPTAPLAIADMLGAAPDRILVVGDSDIDVITAHNAGMHAAGVTWGYRTRDVLVAAGADHIVNKPIEILGLL